jgi:hypothetical protein
LALRSFKVGFKGSTFFQVGLFTRRQGLLIQCTRSIGLTFDWEFLYLVGKPCNASLNLQKRQEERCREMSWWTRRRSCSALATSRPSFAMRFSLMRYAARRSEPRRRSDGHIDSVISESPDCGCGRRGRQQSSGQETTAANLCN